MNDGTSGFVTTFPMSFDNWGRDVGGGGDMVPGSNSGIAVSGSTAKGEEDAVVNDDTATLFANGEKDELVNDDTATLFANSEKDELVNDDTATLFANGEKDELVNDDTATLFANGEKDELVNGRTSNVFARAVRTGVGAGTTWPSQALTRRERNGEALASGS